ncbi:MAG: LpxI family protein [Gemmobacter sp.]
MTRTALIAGRGSLPAALVAAAPERPFVAAMDGFLPDGITPDMTFRLERLMPFLATLRDAGVGQVVFAGAVTRPQALEPGLIDPATAEVLPALMQAMQAGDDATLRAVIALFQDQGFAVAGPADVATDLLPGPGLLAGALTPRDEADATRAAAIVAALGAVDVGQGAVVQQGLCLAVEALPGTDAMLAAVAAMPPALRPAMGQGLLYKAPKPHQDRRIDLPAIGPATVAAAARAGLGGITFEAGGTILLDRAATIDACEGAGLFLWSRAP